MMNESSTKQHHLFNDETMTFKQLKDTLSDALGDRVVKMSRKVPMIDLYLTKKDGDWFVSSYVRPSKWIPIRRATQLNEVESSSRSSVASTIEDIAGACQKMDQVFMNKCFANGINRAHIALVCPPEGCDEMYGDKCFLVFKGIDCFDEGGKCIGTDNDLGVKFLYNLNSSDDLHQEMAQVPAEKLACIKTCRDEEKVLAEVIEKLSKLVDGLGWGCSLRDYIEDKYSRYIVNKALEHGLDISRNGHLVNELVSRLSGSKMRPTKSDLMTFAKREGIDCKTDAYKSFLADIENDASRMNDKIISPIEKIIYYAISCAANNMIAMMSVDPNPKAQKLLSSIATSLFNANDSIDTCRFDIDSLQDWKKTLAKICAYKDIAPAEVRMMHNRMPYSFACDCKKLQKLCDMI